MHYVYVIQSINSPDQIYIGSTEDLQKRLSNHNAGTTPHTSKYKPWEFIVFLGFKDKECAVKFERYLKCGSERALLKNDSLFKTIIGLNTFF